MPIKLIALILTSVSELFPSFQDGVSLDRAIFMKGLNSYGEVQPHQNSTPYKYTSD